MAASTHPFSRATAQKQTDRDHYAAMAQEMQAAARRLMICGMHVHVGIDDDDLRIDLQNQLVFPAASARAVVLVAVLGRERTGAHVLPPDRLQLASAHGIAGALRQLRRSSGGISTR